MGQWMEDYIDSKDRESWLPCSRKAESNAPLPLKDRIRLARAHMRNNGQQNDALWPHQRFALTIGELLEAAERGA